jgi:hypothetical protein
MARPLTKLEAEQTRTFPHMTQFFLPFAGELESEEEGLRDFAK